MTARAILGASAGGSAAPTTTYVDDVFSTWLYNGNGSTQTINNGIDLATYGGMVWTKCRSLTTNNALIDTVRGISSNPVLYTNTTGAGYNQLDGITAFSSTGYTLGADVSTGYFNTSSRTYAAWTFRKAPKFFDVVTYTGDGVAGRQITHGLGVVPGMVVIKRIDNTGNWITWHAGLSAGNHIWLNLTNAQTSAADASAFGNGVISIAPSSSVFTVGNIADVNGSGATYVAYLFAHDTASDGLIQCGSYIGGSGNTVNLGWEPQFVLVKRSSSTGSWYTLDTSRGMPNASGSGSIAAESAAAEVANNVVVYPTATGFVSNVYNSGETVLYLAIRRPNKPPTTGTQVFNAVARTGTGAATTSTAGFPVDLVITKKRSSTTLTGAKWVDRLRGKTITLDSTTGTAETTVAQSITALDSMTTVSIGTDGSYNTSTHTYVDWFFRRYPGVFDEVCYTGTGVARTVNHNLGVVPELMIVKNRNTAISWSVYIASVGNTTSHFLEAVGPPTVSSVFWNNTSPTASVFTVGTGDSTNAAGSPLVAYLFATKAGISKVGSYTGNGSTQTINCGFTTGARFVMIKRTDSTGNWYVFDTTRGIVAGNDPFLYMNSTAAEVTAYDAIDPDNSGFIVNNDATNFPINVNSATYIYVSLA